MKMFMFAVEAVAVAVLHFCFEVVSETIDSKVEVSSFDTFVRRLERKARVYRKR